MGGSPCLGFTRSGKGLNFNDPQSKLFFKFVEALEIVKPKYFLLENVKMKKEWQDIITSYVKVEPIMIDSALLSAQNRQRIYWTNIPNVQQPKDQNIFLKDIVLLDVYPIILHNLYGGFKEKTVRVFQNKSPTIRTSAGGGHIPSVIIKDKLQKYTNKDMSEDELVKFFKSMSFNDFKDWNVIRKLSPIECERLQNLPDDYTKDIGISPTQRYKMIGNGWTINVIVHILKNINT